MKHAYVLQGSLKGQNFSEMSFEPVIDEVTFARFSADMLSEEEIKRLPQNPPMHLSHPFDEGVVPEMFGYSAGDIFITPKMKSYLEDLEPGVHRYYPFQLFSKNPIAGKTDHGEHYFLLPPPLVDCLVIEQTEFWGDSDDHLSSAPNEKCTLEKSKIEGRHFWRVTVGERFDYACSDVFWEGIKDKVLILSPHTTCTLI